ncbi:hypothetical protein [Streptomyces sp. NPDC002537]
MSVLDKLKGLLKGREEQATDVAAAADEKAEGEDSGQGLGQSDQETQEPPA